MLLPDELKSPAREALYARLLAGPCWSLMTDGAVHVRQVGPREVEDYSAALERCAVIVARRRHERWCGPVIGFEIEPAGAMQITGFGAEWTRPPCLPFMHGSTGGIGTSL